MKNVSFNVEEENAVAIYRGKNRLVTIESMINVARNIKDKEMRDILTKAVTKLGLISDSEFESRKFTYTD